MGVTEIDKSFFNWYTQSLGGMIGILTCIWSYLHGEMVVYGNILNNIDSVGFGGFLASFMLIPLCIVVSILGFIESYSSNDTLQTMSKIVIIATIIIGFLGCKLYFIIPSIFILFKFYGTYIITNNKEDSLKEENNTKENIDAKIRKVIVNKIDIEVKEAKENTLVFGNKSEKDIMQTRITMAKELLSKNSEISFICDLTGLTLEQVNNLKQENI